MRFLLVALLGLYVVSAIIVDGGGGRGTGRFSGSHSSSSSGSSEEHHHHPRPPHRPPHRPPRPSKPKTCADGWVTFSRPQGDWCVKAFNRFIDHRTAENLCQSEGATLTGLQNNAERLKVADMARVLAQQNGVPPANIWLGAKRRANCPTQPSCAPLDTFEWTDGHTTGTGGFHFVWPEPNAFVRNDHLDWGIQTALSIMIHPTSDTATLAYGLHHGDMEDQHLQVSMEFYACGKRST